MVVGYSVVTIDVVNWVVDGVLEVVSGVVDAAGGVVDVGAAFVDAGDEDVSGVEVVEVGEGEVVEVVGAAEDAPAEMVAILVAEMPNTYVDGTEF
jgi:hypothetical protein